MPTATRANGRGDTAARLFDAAVALFAELGYHATTTRDIAERAEMSPAAVYVHYRSKLELLRLMMNAGHQDAYRCLREALARPGTSSDRVANAVAAFAQWHAENQTLARVVQYEYRALPKEARVDVKELRRKIQTELTEEVERGVRAQEFAVGDVDGTVLAIMSLCVDVARWYSPATSRRPAEVGALYADLSLRMLGLGGSQASALAVVGAEGLPGGSLADG